MCWGSWTASTPLVSALSIIRTCLNKLLFSPVQLQLPFLPQPLLQLQVLGPYLLTPCVPH